MVIWTQNDLRPTSIYFKYTVFSEHQTIIQRFRTVFLVTVQIDLTGKLMTISGGGVSDIYRAKQFHFHWGSEDKRGSEHDINDNHFPMEVRLVYDPANSFKLNISSSFKRDIHVILKISY